MGRRAQPGQPPAGSRALMSADAIGSVVGGGLAGIAAALDCADARRAGDAARGARRGSAARPTRSRATGSSLDNGQHVFLRCCTAYRELLDRLGATDGVTAAAAADDPGARARRPDRAGCAAPGCRPRCTSPARWPRYPFLGCASARRVALGDAARCDRRSRRPGRRRRGRSATGSREHGQGRRAVDAIWDLIARPDAEPRAPRDASLAQAAYVFQDGSAARRGGRRRRLRARAARRDPRRGRAPRARARRGRGPPGRAAPSAIVRRGRRLPGRVERRAVGVPLRRRGRSPSPRPRGAAAARRGGRRQRPARRGSAPRRSSTCTSSTTAACCDCRSPPAFDSPGAVGLRPHRERRPDATGSTWRSRCRQPTPSWR